MIYADFARIMNPFRMNRYLAACAGNTRKAMTLYRKNLQLTQELFTVISCFEVALRNAINRQYLATLGNDWLRNAASQGGMFDNQRCIYSKESINEALIKVRPYNHNKLVAELGFGFWRYMFANAQFMAAGNTLMQIIPSRPQSTPQLLYNHNYIFNQLALLNDLRNRMAHHEPICFQSGIPVKDTSYARQHYNLIIQLFQWMDIDENALLYGLDHINKVCDEIDNL